MPTDLLSELNELQAEVVTTTEGPLLVLAGAGSGKTRSVIYRAAYLILEKKVPPWNLLIVTFTNKAAGELKDRLEALLHFPVNSLWVGTFHSVCTRILRFESKNLPFHSNFSIYDEDDQKALLKKIYKQLNLDAQKYPLARMLNTISGYKNRLLLPDDLTENAEEIKAHEDFYKAFLNAYTSYQQQLLLNQAMDFDDLLLWTVRLLENNQAVREKYQKQFRYVMIDEYQDTNYAQFKLVNLIASAHQNICVVGDDDQAIYSWRGASIRNILEFEHDYRNVKTIRLEQNYRSPNSILKLANSLIKHNKRRHPKELWSELGAGEKPRLFAYEDENDEARQTIAKIIKLHKSGVNWHDFAVLYRTNAQSRVFEYACVENKVPYSIVGSLYFYQRKEIKDLIAYLKVLANPQDNENLLRIINEPPRGIGQTSVYKLISYASEHNLTLYKTLQQADKIENLQSSIRNKISEFSQMLERWRLLSLKQPVLEVVKTVLEELKWIELYQNSHDPKEISRAENLAEFVSAVSEFTDKYKTENDKLPLLTDYLPFVALQTDLDQLTDSKNTVRLMTMHNAKGLEFDYVFIVGMEQELLPHRMSMDTQEEIEEERRLFYVAVTRTKKRLHLSYAKFRRMYDTYYYTQPSMFLQELDPDSFINIDSPELRTAPHPPHKRKKMITESMKFYRIGQKVAHPDYGEGIVLSVDGEGSAARVTVSFKNGKLAKIIGSFLETLSD
ncbi:MAG TPA: UvrD-helicase domain-containing protein [Candidatus Cloacimonadota bacterium]|nr:UvrD-helicase domain-containing protein [Candidatus Cloacimonadota bacterium]